MTYLFFLITAPRVFVFLQKDAGSGDSSHPRESDRSSDSRRSRPLLGYDWIAGAAFYSLW